MINLIKNVDKLHFYIDGILVVMLMTMTVLLILWLIKGVS